MQVGTNERGKRQIYRENERELQKQYRKHQKLVKNNSVLKI